MRDGCFSSAMWIFSYEYFISAINIPYIFSQTPVPKSSETRNKVLFWTVLAACILSPCLYASLLAYGNITSFYNPDQPPEPWFTPTYLTVKYTIGLEQLVSGVFTIIAILLIRKFLNSNGMAGQVNHHKLFAHVFTFVMYCTSLIVFYYYLAVYMMAVDPQHSKDALIAWIVTTYMNFIV
jgi:hypothetical protein